MDDNKKDIGNETETDEKLSGAGLAGHDADQFSVEGYEKTEDDKRPDEKGNENCDEKDQAEFEREADCEGRTVKLSGQCGDNRQADFVDDKEYLASTGGGRSFKYTDELTNETEAEAESR